MISTAGTVVATVKILLKKGCAAEIYVAASHGLFTGDAKANLKSCPIAKIFITDSLPCQPGKKPAVDTVSLADCIAVRMAAA